jgi:hypothetical protein
VLAPANPVLFVQTQGEQAVLALDPGDGSRSGPPQECGSNEEIDHVAASRKLKTPQAGRLGERQPETRHLDELGANSGGYRMHF